MGPDSLYCGEWKKNLKSCHDLDLGLTMLNIELVHAIFIFYDVFQFIVPRSISFEFNYRAKTVTNMDAHTLRL